LPPLPTLGTSAGKLVAMSLRAGEALGGTPLESRVSACQPGFPQVLHTPYTDPRRTSIATIPPEYGACGPATVLKLP